MQDATEDAAQPDRSIRKPRVHRRPRAVLPSTIKRRQQKLRKAEREAAKAALNSEDLEDTVTNSPFNRPAAILASYNSNKEVITTMNSRLLLVPSSTVSSTVALQGSVTINSNLTELANNKSGVTQIETTSKDTTSTGARHEAVIPESPLPSLTEAKQFLTDNSVNARQVSNEVVKPSLATLEQELPRLEYDSYMAAWQAWQSKGISQSRFEYQVGMLIESEKAKDAHDRIMAGVALVQRAIQAELMLEACKQGS